jgi:iron complex outermembrane receptor protein
VSFVAGLFWSDTKVIQDYLREMFVNPRDDTTTSVNKTLGLYGRATWNFNPDTSLLTGLRLNQDKISYDIVDRAGGFASAASDTSTATVGDLTLRQKLGKDKMVYGTVAKGYKPRAYNTAQTLTSDDPIAPVDKENIQHVEFGAKMTLLDGSLAVNAALFNTDYKNYQVQVYDTTSVIEKLKLSNAGAARTTGLELDATLAASSATTLTASAALIDARFITYRTAPCYPGQTEAQGCTPSDTGPVQDVSGKPMPDSPKFKMTLGANHFLTQDLLPWDIRLNAQYSWRTHANFQADQNPYTVQGHFGILNVGASATSPDGRYMVSLFVNNVTNRFYNSNEEDFFSGLWGPTANAVIGEPARDARRYGGIRFNVYFD